MAESLGDLEVALRANTASWEGGLARATVVTTAFANRTMAPLVNVAAMFRTVGVVMFGVGAAGAFALSKMIKPAMDFQDQMSQVATMVDDTGKHMDDFTTGLSDLAIRFGESTEVLSKGLYDILSATIAPAEALEVLEVAARAAAGGMTDTGTAADAITTILNAYQLAASEAADVSDLLFAIVRRGKLTFADLAPSIGRVAASAALAGLPMEELGASISTITRAGIPARIATTSLNAVIKTFMSPTKDAQAAARKLGIELSTVTLRSKGLTGVLVELAGLQPELVGKIFPNVRALRAMAAILQGATGYAYDYQVMLNRAGMATEAFEKRVTTLAYAFERLKQAGLALVRSIGTALIPEFTNLSDILTAISMALLELGPSVAKTLAYIAAGVPIVAMFAGAFLLLLGPLTKVAIFITTSLIPAFIAMAMTPIGLITILLSLTAAIFGGISVFKKFQSLLDGVGKALDKLAGKTKKDKDETVDLGKSVTDLLADYKELLTKIKTLDSETEEYKETKEELLEVARKLSPEIMLLTSEFNSERLSIEDLNEALAIHFKLLKQRVQWEEAQRRVEGFNAAVDRMRGHLAEVETTPVLKEGFWQDVYRGFQAFASAAAGFIWSPEWEKGLALTEEGQKDIIKRLKEMIKLGEVKIEQAIASREEIEKDMALTELEIRKGKEFERLQKELHDLILGWLMDERIKKEEAVKEEYQRLHDRYEELGKLEEAYQDMEVAGVKVRVSLEEWRDMRLLEIRTKSVAALAKIEGEMLESAKEKQINALLEEFKALEKYQVLRADRRREIAKEIYDYAKEQTEKLAELGAEHGRAEWRVLLDIVGYWQSWKDIVMTVVDDWYHFLLQREEEIVEIYRKAASKRRETEDAEFAYRMLIGEKTLKEEIERLELQSENASLSAKERDAILTKLFKKRQDLIKLENDLEQARFLLQKARGLVTLEDEIENQEKIVAKTKEGTIERVKEETTLAGMRATLAEERIAEAEAQFEFYREAGLRSIQDEIAWREKLLVAEGISQERRKELTEKILDLKKDLAEEEKAIADSRLAYEKFIGEATLADEIETLQEELAAAKEFSEDYWDIKLKIAQKEKDLADERLALHEGWLRYQKVLDEESLEDEIAILNKRLVEEKLSELEYVDILTEIAVKEKELKEIQKRYEEDLMAFRRLTGKKTIADEIKFWEERLDAEKAGTSEYIAIDTTLYNLREQRRKEEEEAFDSSVRASKEAMYAKAQQAIDYWNLMGHGREAEILETKISQEKLLDAVTKRLQTETEGYGMSSQVYVQWSKWSGERRALIEQQTADKIAEIDKKYGEIEMKQTEARLDYEISIGTQTSKAKIDFLEWYLAGLREGTAEEKKLRTDILTLAEQLGGDELRIYDEMAKRGHEVRRELIGVTIEYGDEELKVLEKLRDAVEEYVDFEISEVGELPASWWEAGKTKLEATRTWLRENYEEYVDFEKKINEAVKEGTEAYIEHVKERLDQELELSELSRERQYALLIAFYDTQIAEAEKAAEFDEEAYRKLVYEKALLTKEFSDYRKDIQNRLYEYERLIGTKTLEDEIARVRERLATEKMSIGERIKLLTLLFNLSKQLVEDRERLASQLFAYQRHIGEKTIEDEIIRINELLEAEGLSAEKRLAFLTALFAARKEFLDEREALEEQMFQYERLIGTKSLEDEVARVRERLEVEKLSVKERIELLTLWFNLSKQLIDERERLAERQFEFERTLGEATLKDEVVRQAEMLAAYRETGREKMEIIDKQIDLYNSLVALEKELTEEALKRGATNAEIAAILEKIWLEHYETLTGSTEGFAAFYARRLKSLIETMNLVGDTMEERWSLTLERMRARIESWFTQIHPIFEDLGEIAGGFVSEFADAFSEALVIFMKRTEDMEEVWQRMWQRLVAYAVEELLKLIAYKIVMWFLSLIGLKGGGEVGGPAAAGSAGAGAAGMAAGGAVKQAEDIISRYARSMQKGGEVLVRAHVGEYMIPEWMTSFIKRTKSVPGELVESIAAGRPPRRMQEGGEVTPGAAQAIYTWNINFMPGSRFTEADKASTRAWFENEIWPLERELRRRE